MGHSFGAEKAIVIVWFGFDWELEIHFIQEYSFARVPELQNAWKVVGQFFINCSFSSSSVFSTAHFQKGSSIDVEDGVQKKEGWIFLKLFFESVLPSHGVQKNGLTRRKKPGVWLIKDDDDKIVIITMHFRALELPSSSVGKDSTCNAGDSSSIPRSGSSPGEGISYTLQYSWASLVA